ncbi:MAG: FAD-dependent oxidoreductase [Pseudomonadota bacterium]
MSGVIVVGGGQAGQALCEKLRGLGYEGDVTLICGEDAAPYQRPPLSKAYLLGDMTRERLSFRPEAFYDDQGITLRKGEPVTGVDLAAREVVLGGQRLSYETLALTTGAVARRLPAAIGGGLDGVHTVRTLADIDAMEPQVVEGKHALIVGGGYIGLEAAAVARKRGMQVTLVELGPRILARVAAEETSDYFRTLHAGQGVKILEGCGLEALLGDTSVTGARLSTGEEIAVDLAIVGIGIDPDTALAKAAGLRIENGIAVNQYGRTSEPSVWAAGDCASFPYRCERIRLESVQNAIDQAKNVAANILGGEVPYQPHPWFWSDQYDVKLQIAGLNTGYTQVVTRRGEKGQSHWYYSGNSLLAVDAMNDPRAYMVGKRLIEAGKSPAPEVVADPATDLKPLLQA